MDRNEQSLLAPARYVLIPLAAKVTGYTEKAIRCKIDKGIWREGAEYRIAPDGRVFVDLRGHEKWVEQGRASKSAMSA